MHPCTAQGPGRHCRSVFQMLNLAYVCIRTLVLTHTCTHAPRRAQAELEQKLQHAEAAKVMAEEQLTSLQKYLTQVGEPVVAGLGPRSRPWQDWAQNSECMSAGASSWAGLTSMQKT